VHRSATIRKSLFRPAGCLDLGVGTLKPALSGELLLIGVIGEQGA